MQRKLHIRIEYTYFGWGQIFRGLGRAAPRLSALPQGPGPALAVVLLKNSIRIIVGFLYARQEVFKLQVEAVRLKRVHGGLVFLSFTT